MSAASPTAIHLVPRGRGVFRLALTPPPHFRTGKEAAPAGPTPVERQAVAALRNSEFARLEQAFRHGTTKATVSTPKPQKQGAKKIRQVLEHHAGNH